jgi:hypothetical protein
MTSKKPIKSLLLDISSNIEQLEDEKNIGNILKTHENVNKKIKNAEMQLNKLKNKFEKTEFESKQLSDTQYEKIINNLSTLNIESLCETKDLETLIDDYYELQSQINSCNEYLKKKKSQIINCDLEKNSTKKFTIDTSSDSS